MPLELSMSFSIPPFVMQSAVDTSIKRELPGEEICELERRDRDTAFTHAPFIGARNTRVRAKRVGVRAVFLKRICSR